MENQKIKISTELNVWKHMECVIVDIQQQAGVIMIFAKLTK